MLPTCAYCTHRVDNIYNTTYIMRLYTGPYFHMLQYKSLVKFKSKLLHKTMNFSTLYEAMHCGITSILKWDKV